jgi:hypothetical protein
MFLMNDKVTMGNNRLLVSELSLEVLTANVSERITGQVAYGDKEQ